MNNAHVVLYSASDDPFVHAVRGRSGFDLVHVDELEPYINPSAWPEVLEVSFPEAILDRFDGATLHNRLFSLEETVLNQKLRDHKYQASWVHIALEPVYGRARETVHDIGVRGVSRGLLPLNTQWWAINEQGIDTTPHYVYAFGSTEPDTSHLRDPIRKSIWSLHDWKEERHFGFGEDHWHPFYVERPRGTPVICNFAGDAMGFIFLKGTRYVPLEEYERLTKAIKTAFGSSVGEFLTFIEEDGTIRFYAFSPLTTASVKDPAFIARVSAYTVQAPLHQREETLPSLVTG